MKVCLFHIFKLLLKLTILNCLKYLAIYPEIQVNVSFRKDLYHFAFLNHSKLPKNEG